MLCDVLEISACHILLGRPWKYDKRTIHNGYTNTYTIKHERKKELMPLPPHWTIQSRPNKNPVHLINREVCEKEVSENGITYLLFNKEVLDDTLDIPPELQPLLVGFVDVFPEELPQGLLPIRGIEH